MDVSVSDGFLRVPAKGGKTSKKIRTPFWFFMMEQKEIWEKEGRWDNRRTMEELVQANLPMWKEKKDDPVFLAPYIQQTREWKLNRRNNLENVYDSLGRPLAEIQREAQRVRKREEDMNREVEETVKSAHSVVRTSFFVAHFNSLCKTEKDVYIPCEGAVVEFSLEKGVVRCWQEFLSPMDSIPMGYKYKCIQTSRVTHNLTPDFEHYQNDYKKIMDSLIQFVGGETKMPPLYVMPSHMDAADYITKFISTRAKTNQEFKVFSVTKLLLELGHYPNIHIAQALMEDDQFSHHSGLGCNFHESLNNPHHCSLSICKRMVFTMSSACSNLYRLRLKPDRHLPPDQVEQNLANKLQLANISFVREERINRKVPTPGGVVSMPHQFDHSLMVSKREGDAVSSQSPEKIIPEYTGGKPSSTMLKVAVPNTNLQSTNKKRAMPSTFPNHTGGARPKTGNPYQSKDIRVKEKDSAVPVVQGWGDNIQLV